jgi:hypothetical protein
MGNSVRVFSERLFREGNKADVLSLTELGLKVISEGLYPPKLPLRVLGG